MTTIAPIQRALLSVSNKDGIVAFAKSLASFNIELISTGGTSEVLKKAGISHRQVEEITGLPEMLDGRVKTLHPLVHGGILGRRDQHADEARLHGIKWIDLVVVNFYPFADAIKTKSLDLEQAIEFIDVGGPTMVRAAAKNNAFVTVVIDPLDYPLILSQLSEQKGINERTRKKLAAKVFAETARYDAMIADFFLQTENNAEVNQEFPAELKLDFKQALSLRYGENPHQKACAYTLAPPKPGLLSVKQYQGKALSYNNILDAEAACMAVAEFSEPACVIIKHANPCGAAQAASIETAYEQAYQADSLSAFGGIIALNRPCTAQLADEISKVFVEVLLASAYTDEALSILSKKPNMRVLQLPQLGKNHLELRFINGGLLVQEADKQELSKADLQLVTSIKPKDAEIESMLFAWRVLKHIKSNAILLAKDKRTVGIGAGQVSRVDAVNLAVQKAGDAISGSILASDAFFPFRDSIDRLANTGVAAIIQPGGSVRDEEVIAACNEHKIAMVFTGKRCFKH
jgi:phosphoribosylaminoimidazolecarboxamide formyltransferase / IMP cyclohydrolase